MSDQLVANIEESAATAAEKAARELAQQYTIKDGDMFERVLRHDLADSLRYVEGSARARHRTGRGRSA